MPEKSRDEIFAWIVAALEKEFECDPADLRPDSHLIDDLDLDSIDAIDLLVRLEEQTGKGFNDQDLKGLRTISDVVDLFDGRDGRN